MKERIEAFVSAKRIAVVGVSRTGKKFGNAIYKEMKERGYSMYIVHPEAEQIEGERCYPNLAALSGQIDGVVICVPPQKAEAVLREAVQSGVANIWLQPGSETPQVKALAEELGAKPVSGKCLLMYAQPVTGFHNWHRTFARLFGQL